jgi:hypothetical protein
MSTTDPLADLLATELEVRHGSCATWGTHLADVIRAAVAADPTIVGLEPLQLAFYRWFTALPLEHADDDPNCGVCRSCVRGTVGIIDAMLRVPGQTGASVYLSDDLTEITVPCAGQPAWRRLHVSSIPPATDEGATP